MSVEVTKLANGLTVVSHAMPEVETISLGIWVGAGSRSEAAAEHGVAHFLEHMAFKGTARRSARDIAEEIEAVGGDLNAATGVDSTAYYARVLRNDLPLALDLLSDIILNPRFEGAELARERDVILQEIASSLDSPEDTVFDLIQEAAYPEQSLGRPILGTTSSVAGFTQDHLKSYLTTHYRARNMVLAAAGAVSHGALVAEAEKRRKLEEAALREQMALEQAQLDAQRGRLRDRNLAEYMGRIQATVNRNWIRPPGATKGLKCTVRVAQIPGGEVVRVVITKSSGNVAFDRSVENAVLQTSPLTQPKDPSLFDRELKFEFEPED